MGLVELILCNSALAQDIPSSSFPFTVSVGMGYRVISLESGIEQYLRKTNNVEGLDLSDSFSNATFIIPYFVLASGFEPHRFIPQIPAHLRLSLDLQWTSSAVFGESTDHETMDVSYYGVDFGDAETKWSHYLQDYSSQGIDVYYPLHPLRLFFLELRPGFGVTASISQVHNTSKIDMDLGESKMLDFIGEESLEEDYGVYTDTTTYATISGMGYSFYPHASLGVRLWNIYLVSNFGYCSERIPLTVSQRTISSDGTDLGSESTSIELDASGFSASLLLEIPLDGSKLPLPHWFHPRFDPSLARKIEHFADQQKRY